MTWIDRDSKFKKRIFKNIKIVMDLETQLDNTFKSNKICTLLALGIGSIIRGSQKNILKQIRDDIDTIIKN